MKCVIIAENFKKALSITERSTGKDLTLPILNSFFIIADNSNIKIISTNLEVGVETKLRGTISEKGGVVIPSKILSLFISTIPKDEKITIESKKNDLFIQTQTQKTTIKGYQPDDFPPFPVVKEIYKFTVLKNELYPVLIKSLVALAKNTIKPELASTYFLFDKENLCIASTDSFRLSEEKIKPTIFSSKMSRESFLLPGRTCEEIIKLLEFGDDERVDFIVGKGEIMVVANETKIYSRLIDGVFPEYQQIIPKKFTTTLVIPKASFSNHIKRASIFSNKLQSVTLSINPDKGELGIESKNAAVGEYTASCKADISGEKFDIVFNYHYLLDGVDVFDGDTVFLGFNGESQPLLMRQTNKESSVYIVMPMKGVV